MKDLPSHPILPARILVVDDESMPRMAITRLGAALSGSAGWAGVADSPAAGSSCAGVLSAAAAESEVASAAMLSEAASDPSTLGLNCFCSFS